MNQENNHMTIRPHARRTRFVLAAAGVAALVAGSAAVASSASAHTPEFNVTCTSASIDLTNYPSGSTVSGTLDGVDLGSAKFGAEGYHGHTALDPKVPHSWSIVVTSGDGDHRYDRTFAGVSDPSCIPVVPPTEEPTPPPNTPPVNPPADVIVPQIQDYVTCKGGAFVLDNTGSTVAVTYTINDLPFVVPAGQAVHTDADGTLLQPNSDFEGFTIKAGDRTWNFPSAGNCPTEPTQPPTDEPTTPPVTPPATTEPTPVPSDQPTEPNMPVETTAPSAPGSATPHTTPAPTTPATRANSSTPSAAPAATEVGTLAYTGSSPMLLGIGVAALLAVGLGSAFLAVLAIRRSRADRG